MKLLNDILPFMLAYNQRLLTNKTLVKSRCKHTYIPAKHLEVRKNENNEIYIGNDDFVVWVENYETVNSFFTYLSDVKW